jgi:hypothetical protein
LTEEDFRAVIIASFAPSIPRFSDSRHRRSSNQKSEPQGKKSQRGFEQAQTAKCRNELLNVHQVLSLLPESVPTIPPQVPR